MIMNALFNTEIMKYTVVLYSNNNITAPCIHYPYTVHD